MIRRTIAAALLAGLVSPALAGPFAGPAYDQAAGLASGKNQADAAYDGGPVHDAVAAPMTGDLRKIPVRTALPAAYPSLEAASVPAPAKEETGKLLSVHNVLYGTDGAPAGKGLGRPLGAAGGALAGAVVGLGIGFAMSKLLS